MALNRTKKGRAVAQRFRSGYAAIAHPCGHPVLSSWRAAGSHMVQISPRRRKAGYELRDLAGTLTSVD